MLLVIAFLCFAILFLAWLLAPSSPSNPVRRTETSPMRAVSETGTSPA